MVQDVARIAREMQKLQVYLLPDGYYQCLIHAVILEQSCPSGV